MRYGFFLLILEGVCIYLLSVYTSTFAFFPDAILVSYLFVSLLALFAPNFSSWRSWRMITIFHILCVIIVFALFYYRAMKDSQGSENSEFSTPQWNALIQSVSSPIQDREPFLYSLQAWVYHQYPLAQRFSTKLTPGKISTIYKRELSRSKERWRIKKRALFSRYPSLRSSFTLFENRDYQAFQAVLDKLPSSSNLRYFSDLTRRLLRMDQDTSFFQSAVMDKHYQLVSKYRALTPTLSLFPNTIKAFPVLWKNIGKRPNLSILDFFVLKYPPTQNLLERQNIQIQTLHHSFSSENFVYEPTTELLLLYNGYWQGKQFSLAKVFANKLLLISGSHSWWVHSPGIQRQILSYDPQMKNPLYYRWFSRSYKGQHKAYYHAYIQKFQEEFFFFIGGLLLSSVIVVMTGLGFRPISKISPISWGLGVFFSLFLSCLYYNVIWSCTRKLLSFWF